MNCTVHPAMRASHSWQPVPIAATDVDRMVQYAQEQRFDLVCVTPDDPLALGMVDRLREVGIRAFGPHRRRRRSRRAKVVLQTP